jgi:hypothetical protein
LEQKQNVVDLLLYFILECGNILFVLNTIKPWTWSNGVDDHFKQHFFPDTSVNHVVELSELSDCDTPLKPGVIPDIDRAHQQKGAQSIVSLACWNSISFDWNAIRSSSKSDLIDNYRYE